jgi:hypothetical protein
MTDKQVEAAARAIAIAWNYQWDCYCTLKLDECDCGIAMPEVADQDDEI